MPKIFPRQPSVKAGNWSLSGFAGTADVNLMVADTTVIENDLTLVLGVGVQGDTLATISGTTDVANIYEFASDLEGDVFVTNFDNGGAGNDDQLDVSALGITALNQLDIVGTGTANQYLVTAHSSQFDGSITVTLVNGGTLTAADFIFA